MKRIVFRGIFLCPLLVLLTAMFLTPSTTHADISITGDIWPATHPSTWTNRNAAWIGNEGIGTMSITNGSSVTNNWSAIGRASGSNGVVTVDGVGSTWTSASTHVGYQGTGRLTITNGGEVMDSGAYIGNAAGSYGTVSVDGAGSAWTSYGDHFIGYLDKGALSITNGGAVAVTGYASIIGHCSQGMVNLDGAGSTWTVNASLTLGNFDTAELNITDGGSATIKSVVVAQESSSNGTIHVDGEESSLTSDNAIWIGKSGKGKLNITNGGLVTSLSAWIGRNRSSDGKVIVNGPGSEWTVLGQGNTGLGIGELYVGGIYDRGILIVTDGALVSANYVSIGSLSTVTLDVGNGSTLKAGLTENNWTGTIMNEGSIHLAAGAGAVPGTYTPICYGTMEGPGIVGSFGGIWHGATHTLTVAEALKTQGMGGATITFDLAVNQRVLITDSLTGNSLGAGFYGEYIDAGSAQGFLEEDLSIPITFTATPANGNDLAPLEILVSETDEEILSAWEFSTEGYAVSSDNPVYLSLSAGSAKDLSNLTVWHLENGQWTEYAAPDLAFDGIYVSFTATSLSTYAVTAPVDNSCSGDLDNDGDVDGLDLFSFISTQTGISTQAFSALFGRNDCP